MIYPTTSDILRCIDQTLLTASDENMPRMAVKSALASCRHMIRHANLRMQMERTILLDDIEKAGVLLDKLATYFQSLEAEQDDFIISIRAALCESPNLLSAAADELDNIIARAKALHELIYLSLSRLQGFSPALKVTEPYQGMRRLMREYMTYQIQQEAKIVYPAFAGKGPRR
jgi:hypothetical protein